MKQQYAVYNPKDKPVEELPVIYGFNNGGKPGWYEAILLAQDGTFLGSHICSDEGFMLGDLGILKDRRLDRHETFCAHYPDGYRMDFVSLEGHDHAGLNEAVRLNQEQAKAAEVSDEG